MLQFKTIYTSTVLKADWIKPELRHVKIPFDMDLMWFISISCTKEESASNGQTTGQAYTIDKIS